MESPSAPIVLVTGASSGIGRECARVFAREGYRLILVARRLERLESLAQELADNLGTSSHLLQIDVRDRPGVERAIQQLPREWADIDILVNNAGKALGRNPVHAYDPEQIDEMIDTNVKALIHVTRSVLPSMVDRNRGHIINIGSIAGHQVYEGGVVYCATKHAVRAFSEGLKIDLHGTDVRVSSVDPGLVETEFSLVRFDGDEAKAAAIYENTRPLRPEDVAEAVLFCASRPAHVNVSEMVLLATDQSTATRIHRRGQK